MEWSLLFFFNSALLGVGLAMDAFSVSMANGLHDPQMSRRRGVQIAGTFGIFQAVMPMTMIRVNIIKGLGPVLQIAEGYTAPLPDEIHNKLDMRTDPTWPTTWFAPRLTGKGAFKDVYSVMANWGANHGAISYGHIGKDLITLASMLRIPVAMHNVADEDIYRPHAWSAVGTKDLESADYRACAAYGPLYK